MNNLDIIGFDLNEALIICNNSNLTTEVVFTRPDKAVPEGNARVARFVRTAKDRWVITAVFEVEKKGGG